MPVPPPKKGIFAVSFAAVASTIANLIVCGGFGSSSAGSVAVRVNYPAPLPSILIKVPSSRSFVMTAAALSFAQSSDAVIAPVAVATI